MPASQEPVADSPKRWGGLNPVAVLPPAPDENLRFSHDKKDLSIQEFGLPQRTTLHQWLMSPLPK